MIYCENEWRAKCLRDRIPHLGVFFLIEGRVHCCKMPYEDTRPKAGEQQNLNCPLEHQRLWERLCSPIRRYRDGVLILCEKGLWARHRVSYWPRGCVTYDKASDTFELAADKHIVEDPKAIEAVISEMLLPGDRVKVYLDPKYICHLCRRKRSPR